MNSSFLIACLLFFFFIESISCQNRAYSNKFSFTLDECRDNCVIHQDSLSSIDSFSILQECTFLDRIIPEENIISTKEQLDGLLVDDRELELFIQELGFKDGSERKNNLRKETFKTLVKAFFLIKINVCSGSCYSTFDLNRLVQAQKILVDSNNENFDEELVRVLVDHFSGFFFDVEGGRERTQCKACSISTDPLCEIDPMISCTIELFDQFVYSWGYFNPSEGRPIFIQKNEDLVNKNFLKVERESLLPGGERRTHRTNDEFLPKTRFLNGYVHNAFFTFSSAAGPSSSSSSSWNLGSRTSTTPRSSRCEDSSSVFAIDSNENSISDVCEIAWITSGFQDFIGRTVPKECMLLEENLKNDLTQKDINELFFLNVEKDVARLPLLQVAEGGGMKLSAQQLNLFDCDENGILDVVEIEKNPSLDSDKNSLLDICEVTGSCVVGSECSDGLLLSQCRKLSSDAVFSGGEECRREEETTTEEDPSTEEEPPTEQQPSTSPPPPTTEQQPEGPIISPRDLGSCYVPQNRFSCIDKISQEYCLYIKGLWSEIDCSKRTDMVEDGELVSHSHRSEDHPSGNTTTASSGGGTGNQNITDDAGAMFAILFLPPMGLLFLIILCTTYLNDVRYIYKYD